MKTEYEKSKADLSKKEELIKSFSEILSEHISNQHEVYELIFTLKDFNRFMSDFNGTMEDKTISVIHKIEDILRKGGTDDDIKNFRKISGEYLKAIIIAGRRSEGISLIYQMENDFDKITD